MKHLSIVASLVSIAALLSCDPATNPTGASKSNSSTATTLSGTVLPTGISAKVVAIQGADSAVVMVDTYGHFRIDSLLPGSCMLEVSAPGFTTSRHSQVLEASGINEINDFRLSATVQCGFSPDSSESQPVSSQILIYFSTPMDTASVRKSLVIAPAISSPLLSWKSNFKYLAITPKKNLLSGTVYTVMIDTSARSASNERLESSRSTWFKTEPFRVIRIEPDSGNTVDTYTAMTIYFTVPANKTSAAQRIRTIPAVQLQFGGSGAYLYFRPVNGPWMNNTQYTVIIDDSLADENGLMLHDSIITRFTTGTSSSSGSGSSISANPLDSSIDVSLNISLSVSFYMPMNTASVQRAFSLKDSANSPIPGTFSWGNSSYLYFQPQQPMRPSTRYTIAIDSTATNAAGAATGSFQSTFRTTAFRINSISPNNGAYNQEISSMFYISFNTPTNNAAVEGALSITPVTSVDLSWNGTSLFARPRLPYLRSNTEYTISIDTSATDIWGNHIQQTQQSVFHTLSAAITSYSPTYQKMNVDLSEPIILGFNTAMDTATVRTALKLKKDGNTALIPGTITQNGTYIYFQPLPVLAPTTRYILTIGTEASDAYGIPMTRAWTSEFTTRN